MSERIYVFKRFERFWHWSQAGLIMFLMLTAFDIHGTYTIFGFEKAVAYHTIAAWSLIGLWVFAIFWHFTTGEWKQYIPTTEKVVAYLAILICVGPLIWVTGVLYLFYDQWAAWGLGNLSLEWVANGHIAGAFMMLAFLIAHVYLTTAGHTPTAHIKAMITGWEEVD